MDVIGFGHLNYDYLFKVENLGSAGSEVKILESKEEIGGSAANTICGLARLGFKTSYLGAIGDDSEGDKILKNLKKENIDTAFVKKKQGNTSKVLIFVDSKGERTMYIVSGVTKTFSLQDIELNQVEESKVLHMSHFATDKQFGLQKTLANQLNKVKISYAPGASVKRGLKELEPILTKTHVLFLNKSEIETVTNLPYEDGAKSLLKLGVKIVAVTLGKEGCYVSDGKSSSLVPSIKTTVVDTTGAGDAFNAGFLSGMLGFRSLKECGRVGNQVASLCIQKLGARDGLPRKEDISLG